MINTALREQFYKPFTDLFYHTFQEPTGTLNYALYGVAPLSGKFFSEVEYASNKLWTIMERVRSLILTFSKEDLSMLGYDQSIINFLSDSSLDYDCVCSRFDVLRNGDSFKFIELNNDTPFLVMENFKMNKELTSALGLEEELPDKEKLLRRGISKAINKAAQSLGKESYTANIVIMSASKEEDLEDYLIANYFYEHVSTMSTNVQLLHFNDIRVDMEEEAVWTDQGKVDILFKPTYPYDYLVDDMYSDGSGNIGLDLMQLNKDKKVALITPPRGYVLQNKSIFAVITGLVGEGSFFSNEEKEFLNKYLPKTYFNNDHFLVNGSKYVSKPCISRESINISIMENNTIMDKSDVQVEDNRLHIYQEYVPNAERTVMADEQYKTYQEILGVFMVDGKYAGTTLRLYKNIGSSDVRWIATYKAD